MARIRADYVFGTTTTALATGDTTLASAELARLPAVTSPDTATITLHDATTGAYENVYITAHTASATTATISRAQEGSTAQAWASGTSWTHGPTAAELASLASSGGVATSCGALAYQATTTQSITNQTDTAVTFNAELFDTDGFHDNTTNPSRLTVPAGKGGTYLLVAGVRFATNSTGVRLIYMIQNGATILGSASTAPSSSYPATPVFSFVAPLVPGDYVQINAYQNSGGALATDVGLGKATFFALYRLGN